MNTKKANSHALTKKPKTLRNHHAHHPIMRKGGVHEKTQKAKRKQQRQHLKRQLTQITDRFFYILKLRII